MYLLNTIFFCVYFNLFYVFYIFTHLVYSNYKITYWMHKISMLKGKEACHGIISLSIFWIMIIVVYSFRFIHVKDIFNISYFNISKNNCRFGVKFCSNDKIYAQAKNG